MLKNQKIIQNVQLNDNNGKGCSKDIDFIKNFCIFENDIITLSENNIMGLYQIKMDDLNGQDIYIQEYKQYQQSGQIYDAVFCKNNQIEMKILAIAQQYVPLSLYLLNEDNNLKSIASINEQIKHTEKFYQPLQIKFHQEFQKLYCGGKQFLFSYDIENYKKDCDFKAIRKQYISCLDLPSEQSQNYDYVRNMIAFGTFDKKISLLTSDDEQIVGSFSAHVDGITQVKFSPKNALQIYTAARQDDYIYQWDLRKLNEFVLYYKRECSTNQRMNFDIDQSGEYLIIGNEDGSQTLQHTEQINNQIRFKNHHSIVNTCKFYQKNADSPLYCISSEGQRSFYNKNQYPNYLNLTKFD